MKKIFDLTAKEAQQHFMNAKPSHFNFHPVEGCDEVFGELKIGTFLRLERELDHRSLCPAKEYRLQLHAKAGTSR